MSINVGDKIKVVNAKLAGGQYKNGDIFTVEQVVRDGDVYVKEHNRLLWEKEYESYNPVNVGDKVKLIDKFYNHEAFKAEPRNRRKAIASLDGKVFGITHINYANRASTTVNIVYSTPLELLEKVEELPKPGDLFKVINNTSPRHFFNTGDVVRFVVLTNSSIYVCKRSDGRRQHVAPSDIVPYTKHRYTDEQVREAQRIIGEIVAGFENGECFYVLVTIEHGVAIRYRAGMNNCYSRFDSRCSPNDQFNRTIGVMVALCRATGRKLPDWIYV